MSQVGDNIKALRIRAGLSQNKLARLAGISQPALSAIEKDVKNPSSTTLGMLASALHVTVAELIGETESGAYSAEERQLIEQYRTLNAQGREYIRQQLGIAMQIYQGKNIGVPVVENRKEG